MFATSLVYITSQVCVADEQNGMIEGWEMDWLRFTDTSHQLFRY
jgi:hypothetical protein